MYLIKINAEPVRIVDQPNVFRNTQFCGYYWAASDTIPEDAEIAGLVELQACLTGEQEFDEHGEPVDLMVLLDEWITEHFSSPVYSITPHMPVVKVGSFATLQISGTPGTTNILIDGDAVEVIIDDSGHVTEIFDVLTAGEYVITGESGELANCVAVIKAVG